MAMERTDSTAAMASLANYDDEGHSSDEEMEYKKAPSSIDNISDDEAETNNSRPPSTKPVVDDENSVASSADLGDISTMKTDVPVTRKPTRLVSYGPDDVDEERSDSDRENEEDEDPSTMAIIVDKNELNSSLDAQQASSLSRSVQNKTADEIELPAEPPGKCSRILQEKITKLYERMRREGLNLTASIQRKTNFRNPSIYEKLIEFCGIDEKGTNFPPEVYDPHSFGKESYYDALDKAQKLEMEKREKERKDRTKIEFVTGTKKPSSGEGPTDEKKRKTKWDSQPQAQSSGSRQNVLSASSVNLTSSATGNKSTVIPAVGNITKKSSGK